MARRALANHPLLQVAGRKLSGTQLWNVKAGGRPVFSVQLTSWASTSTSARAPQPFPHEIEILWPREAQRTEQKSTHAREEKNPILLPSLTNHTTNIPEFKVKGSFHQEPSKTSFQFSKLEEFRFTGHLIFCPPEKFSPFWVTRDQTHQFRSSFSRPLDWGRSGLSKQLCWMFLCGAWACWSEGGGYPVRLQRLCLNTQNLQARKQN